MARCISWGEWSERPPGGPLRYEARCLIQTEKRMKIRYLQVKCSLM